MKKYLLILLLLFAGKVSAQVLVTTFTDPCTKQVRLIVVPLIGSTTVTMYNETRTFTASDVSSGAIYQWINQVYARWSITNPCSTTQATVTATQVASNTVSAVVASAISTPPPAPPAAAPTSSSSSAAPASSESSSSSGGESSSSESSGGGSSESKEESKSESKSDSKSKAKGAAKAARMNPILLNSDFTVAQNLDLSFNAIISTGLSQSSMAGDESYGITTMIWSNLKQFAFNGRYTKMGFKDGKLKWINNFSYTWAYSYGTKMGVLGYAHIRPLDKYGVVGFNVSQITIGLPYRMGVYPDGTDAISAQSAFLLSFTGFYTKSITINKKVTISPEIYVTSNPYMFITRDRTSMKDGTLNILSGVSGDLSITKRFKFNAGARTSYSTNKQIPILFNVLIGSKINI